MKVEFYRHNLNNKDKEELRKVLDSLFLTTGDWVTEFEKKFSEYTGSQYAIGTTSCTDSLFLSLSAMEIGIGDEVITTPMSFVSTANAIEYCGATPIFVDVDKNTGNVEAEKIREKITAKTKAILPVHLYGQMCDMQGLKDLANEHELKIIEDSAHCIEGDREGIRPGQFGDSACYSFYATKTLTCGEGGAIICNDIEIYKWLKKARLHGLSKSAAERYTKKYEHYDLEFLGRKANMTNINAALLIHQIDRIEDYLQRREEIAQIYNKAFEDNPNIDLPKVLSDSKHSRYIYTIWVDPNKRDEYMHRLQELGIGVAVNFRPIHLMKYYREKYNYNDGDFPIAEEIGNRTISIPFYPKLSSGEIEYVIDSINKIVAS